MRFHLEHSGDAGGTGDKNHKYCRPFPNVSPDKIGHSDLLLGQLALKHQTFAAVWKTPHPVAQQDKAAGGATIVRLPLATESSFYGPPHQ